jgi:hypothetical protein
MTAIVSTPALAIGELGQPMQLSFGRAKLEADVFPFKPAKVPKPQCGAFY